MNMECLSVNFQFSSVTQSCPTLCDPIDGSPPGFSVPGILQARTVEWVAISFSNAWKWKVKMKSLSHVRLLATPWTVAYQAPPSMGFPRKECWSGVPLLVDHNLSSPNWQRYVLQPLHVGGWDAQNPGCPSADSRWVCKPPAVGCWSICQGRGPASYCW